MVLVDLTLELPNVDLSKSLLGQVQHTQGVDVNFRELILFTCRLRISIVPSFPNKEEY